jgi:hypothetical protein
MYPSHHKKIGAESKHQLSLTKCYFYRQHNIYIEQQTMKNLVAAAVNFMVIGQFLFFGLFGIAPPTSASYLPAAHPEFQLRLQPSPPYAVVNKPTPARDESACSLMKVLCKNTPIITNTPLKNEENQRDDGSLMMCCLWCTSTLLFTLFFTSPALRPVLTTQR